MATTFSTLLATIGGNGLPEAIVQRKAMDHAIASNLFWITVGGGLVFTIGFAASGPWLAQLYNDSRVSTVTVAMSSTILLTSASVVHLALLQRAMRFYAVSLNEVFARVAYVGVPIPLALAGWGYWSLVAGAVAQSFSKAVGAWLICRWLPALPKRALGTLATMRFAMNTYGRFSINYVTRNSDKVIVGSCFGAETCGFYKKAYDLFALCASQFVNTLTLVAVSALGKMDSGSAQLQRCLLRAIAIMALFGMGLAANLTLVGPDLLGALLGPGWEEAGRVFRFFGPGIGAMMVYSTHGWIHLSLGRADRWLRWGIVEFAVTVLLFGAGLPWGPVGIAIAWTGSFWVLMIPSVWYSARPLGLCVGTIIGAVWRHILASVLAGGVTAFVVRTFPFVGGRPEGARRIIGIIASSAVLWFVYLGATVIIHRSWAPLYQMYGLVRDMMPRVAKVPERGAAAAGVPSM